MHAARTILAWILRILGTITALLVWLWTIGALFYTSTPWAGVRLALALLFAVALPLLFLYRRTRRYAPLVLGIVFALALVRFFTLEASNSRDWVPNERYTAWADIQGDRVTVYNVRNTSYRSDSEYEVRYETRTYDLSELRDAWFLMVPFQGFEIGAHTFVSFGFDDDSYLALSIEARKEKGESYGILEGLYRRFEVIYIAGDERDLIGLRTHIRGDTAYLYPMRSTEEGLREFFLDMIQTMNELHEEPDFYNSLTSTCTTGLLDHLNRVRRDPIPLSIEILLPGLSDERAYEFGLIETDLPLPEARERFRVDPAAATLDDPDFSAAIRRR